MPNLNDLATQVCQKAGEGSGEVKKILKQLFIILARMESREVESILRRYRRKSK